MRRGPALPELRVGLAARTAYRVAGARRFSGDGCFTGTGWQGSSRRRERRQLRQRQRLQARARMALGEVALGPREVAGREPVRRADAHVAGNALPIRSVALITARPRRLV